MLKFCPVVRKLWTNMNDFVQSFLYGTIPSCPFRSREMFLYDLFDEFAAQIFLLALVAISRMRNVPLKLERKNLSEILTEGIKKTPNCLGVL